MGLYHLLVMVHRNSFPPQNVVAKEGEKITSSIGACGFPRNKKIHLFPDKHSPFWWANYVLWMHESIPPLLDSPYVQNDWMSSRVSYYYLQLEVGLWSQSIYLSLAQSELRSSFKIGLWDKETKLESISSNIHLISCTSKFWSSTFYKPSLNHRLCCFTRFIYITNHWASTVKRSGPDRIIIVSIVKCNWI